MKSYRIIRSAGYLVAAAWLAAGAAFAQGTIPVGALPPGESVQITFSAVIRNDGPPFPIPFGTTFVVNQGTVNGNFTTLLTDDPDDITGDMDPTVTPLDLLTLGNVVWIDLDGNGVFDGSPTDMPVDGVRVNLYTDDGTTANVLDVGDTFRAFTTTAGGGLWSFVNLTPGDYIAEIPASNFAAAAPLDGYFSLSGAPDPDGNVDNDDNGVDEADPATNGVASMAITLVTDTEPDTPADGDDTDGNLTLDFGFTQIADIAVTKSVDVTTVIAGDAVNGVATYTLTVANGGPATATNVVVQDDLVLPAGVTLTGNTPSQGTFTAGTGVWQVGTINSGSDATLMLEITAASSAAHGAESTNQGSLTSLDQIDDNAANDTSALITVTVEREVDIRVEKAGVPDPDVVAGAGGGTGNLVHTVTVTNDGPSDATTIVIDDAITLPAGVTNDTPSPSQGSFAGTTWTLGDLASGASATLTITYNVSSAAADGASVDNTASLDSVTETETDSANDSATVNTNVVREVDIRVEKAGVPDPNVVAGAGGGTGNLTHTVTVTNDGPSDATTISIEDVITLPAGVTNDTPSPSQGSFAGTTWTLGDLVSGASATLTIVYNVASGAADGASVDNTASLGSVTETETNGANDSATVNTGIVREVDIRVEKVGVPDPNVAAGAAGGVGNLVHTVTVTNDGPSDSTAIVIEDVITLPAAVTVDPPTPSQGGFAGTTWTLGDLVSGGSATLTIVYNVASSALAGTTVNNVATLDSVTETETNAANDSDTVVTTIVRVANLTLTKTESADPVLAGIGAGNLVYVVTVDNGGPSDITGLALDEAITFPAGVTLDTVVVSAGAYAPPNGANGTWTLDMVFGASETLTATLTVDETAATGTDVISDTLTVSGSAGGETLGGDPSVTESTSILSDKDYGDAPDPVEVTSGKYPTLMVNNGPRHLLIPGDVFLGASVDAEADGQPTIGADGDDLAATDDEDGVTFAGGVIAGGTTEFDVVASGAGLLSVWVDFEVDGDWTGAGEQVFTDEPLVAGVNTLSFVSPTAAFDSDLATLLGGTFVRFRFSSGGGLSPTGYAAGGEVEDYFITILTEADLAVTLDQAVSPIVAGDVQLYDVTVTNNGPAVATDVTLQQELPPGAILLGVEPSSIECSLLSGILVECDLGEIQPTESVDLTVGVLMDHRLDGTVSSEALAAGVQPDPDSSNDEAEVDTDVAPHREMVATSRGAAEALAMIAKEGDNSVGLVFAEPQGGGDREYSVEGIGFRATSLTEVPTFGGTTSPEIAALAAGFGGETKVLVVDANNQALLGDYDILGDWFAMDIVSVPDFGGGPAPELAVLLRAPDSSEVRVQVLDAGTGVVVRDHLVATSTPNPPGDDIAAPFPIGMARVDDFGDSPSPELAILMKNPDTEDVNVLVVDADSGGVLGDHSQGTDLFPLGIVDVGDLGLGGGTPAPDVAILLRRASDGDLFATVLDAANGTPFGPIDFDDTLLPGPFTALADFGGSPAPEIAVTGREDPDTLTVSVKDAATGVVVSSIGIASTPLVPLPLGQVHHDHFAGGPEPDLSVLFEFFDEPSQVQVFNGAGGAPLFTFFLP